MQNKISIKQWKRQGKEMPDLNCKGYKKELHSHVDRKPSSVYTKIKLASNKKFLSNLLYGVTGLLLLGSHWGARQLETLTSNASFSITVLAAPLSLAMTQRLSHAVIPHNQFSPRNQYLFIYLNYEWWNLLSLHFKKNCIWTVQSTIYCLNDVTQ